MPAESASDLDIYLIAIGGSGMAPLACLLKEAGHAVRGSDGPLYPPMSTLLESCGIAPLEGYEPGNLEPRPDLVVVGNAVPRTNPEAVAVEAAGIERISMPQALYRFFLDRRRPLVVAGTHGKTTTTALAAWVYAAAGRDPGFLIGGAPLNFDQSFARGTGERFIIEGDEYNAAYFDRGPKFLHYRPDTLILTSVEYDHADLYESPEALREAYRRLVRSMAPEALLVAWADSDEVRSIVDEAPCRTLTYGFSATADVRAENVRSMEAGLACEVAVRGAPAVALELPMSGRHNLANALAVYAAAREDDIEAGEVVRALAGFRGVRRRQEVVGEARGVTVIDDFAHHPTAVAATLEGLRGRYPGRRLVVALEPRSLTAARRLFYEDYLGALRLADRVWLAPVFHAGRFTDEERLDTAALAKALGDAGTPATACDSIAELHASLLAEMGPGDLVVTMSSGSFEGLPQALAAAL